MNKIKQSVISILICYIIWGIFPLYFELLHDIPAQQIVIQRIIHSFIFMLLLIFFTRNYQHIWKEIKQLTLLTISYNIIASLLITINWLTYIIAILHQHVLEASFGYYLNPIITILLAVLFLKERLTHSQLLACSFVILALIYLFVSMSTLPWISLILALTFGCYSLCKKKIKVSAMTSLLLETAFVTPIALIYLSTHTMVSVTHLATLPFIAWLLLGATTVIPLLLFAQGTKYIPLYLTGILQYIPPTIQFILGITIFNEALNVHRFIAFILIWTGVLIFCYSVIKQEKYRQ